MKRAFLIVLMASTFALPFSMGAEKKELPAEDAFVRANTAFVSGKYAEAAREDASLISRDCVSAAIFYNLANACLKDGKIGPAILNYERALWLAPGDAEIRANLRLARRQAGLFDAAPSGWRALTGMLGLDAWTRLAAGSVLLTVLAALARAFKLDAKWSLRPWIVLFFLATVVFSVFAAARALDLDRAVIVDPDALLRVAPLEGSPSIFNLSAGSTVRVQKSRADFFYVRTDDGKTGWVAVRQAQKVVP